SEPCLRQTSSVLYIAVDTLIPFRGSSLRGLDEFTAALDHEGIPAVWLTSRSRLQFDDPLRKHGHTHPFIAEDGCAVYLPEDYFHLRPSSDPSRRRSTATVRLGRFTCIPVAEPLPAAADALQTLSQDTGVPVVTLHSLSPRELARLYDRALRYHAHILGIATPNLAPELFPFCERTILLNENTSEKTSQVGHLDSHGRHLSLHARDLLEQLLSAISTKNQNQ